MARGSPSFYRSLLFGDTSITKQSGATQIFSDIV